MLAVSIKLKLQNVNLMSFLYTNTLLINMPATGCSLPPDNDNQLYIIVCVPGDTLIVSGVVRRFRNVSVLSCIDYHGAVSNGWRHKSCLQQSE